MLTTAISLATSCLTETWLSTPPSGIGLPGIVLGNPHDPNCWPYDDKKLATTFSPAICPFGYASACDSGPHAPSETAWACCPGGFSCDGGIWQCVLDPNPGGYKTYTVTDLDILGNTITTQTIATGGLNAHSIKVAFHSSDIMNQVTSMTTSMTRSSTGSSTRATQATSSSLPLQTADTTYAAQDSDDWPKEAWIAIGAAMALAIMVLLSGIICLVRRRKKAPPPPTPPKNDAAHVHELSNTPYIGEMEGNSRFFGQDVAKMPRQDGIKPRAFPYPTRKDDEVDDRKNWI
ncbi:hypothetical protein GGS20DRAFT_121838 [Poronia punctata]|nr:hypothetical protein GGS20DRAFT_121838 [Poronia punctata]